MWLISCHCAYDCISYLFVIEFHCVNLWRHSATMLWNLGNFSTCCIIFHIFTFSKVDSRLTLLTQWNPCHNKVIFRALCVFLDLALCILRLSMFKATSPISIVMKLTIIINKNQVSVAQKYHIYSLEQVCNSLMCGIAQVANNNTLSRFEDVVLDHSPFIT